MTPLLTSLAAAALALALLHGPLGGTVVVALALLTAAVRAAPDPRAAALASYAFATSGMAVLTGGAVGLWSSAPLLAPVLALPFALPGWVAGRLRRERGAAAADAALVLAWLLVEAAWVHLAGAPMFRIGYAVAGTPLVRLAGLAGAGTVSAAAWGLALALANAARAARGRRPRRPSGAAAATLRTVSRTLLRSVLPPLGAVATAYAALALLSTPPPPATASSSEDGAFTQVERSGRGIRVALVQTDVRASDRRVSLAWPEAESALEERTVALLRQAAASGADVVVGPEGSLRAADGELPAVVVPRFPGSRPGAVLVGAIATGPAGRVNAVVDLAAGGEIRYVKRHPVPVSERRFTPGSATRPLSFGTLRIAPSICYDLLFAREIREDARRADLLVAVSDAAFAERSALPSLHLGVARIRAAENGKPLAFVTATGPTALVDGDGRLLGRTERLEPRVLVADVPPEGEVPPYARFGLEADLVVLAAGSLLWARRGVRPLADAARRP